MGSIGEQSAQEYKGCAPGLPTLSNHISPPENTWDLEFHLLSPVPGVHTHLPSFETFSDPSHCKKPSQIVPFPAPTIFHLNSTISYCTSSIPCITKAMDANSCAHASPFCPTRSLSITSKDQNPTLPTFYLQQSLQSTLFTASTQNRPWLKTFCPSPVLMSSKREDSNIITLLLLSCMVLW